jgi:peptidoglycan/xylan/chitin deacetylase (PgdA/CDA1 family)
MNYTSKTKFPLQGLTPLVLHRIVKSIPEEWEDVREERLREIVDYIDGRWAVFDGGHVKDGARWMLTFDDGHVSDYEIVFPLLQEYGMSATFFLITSRIGEPGFLNWDQIQEMCRNGMCFGSHSVTHRLMTTLSEKEAKSEFIDSKMLLEDRLKSKVNAFSYPQGACSKRLHNIALSSGYTHLCSSRHGTIGNSRQVFPRNSIHSGMGMDVILSVMDPTIGIRMRWLLEEGLKQPLKSMLGYDGYDRLRDRLLLKK